MLIICWDFQSAIQYVSDIHRVKSYTDRLYVLYQTSAKHTRELQVSANLLETQLLKIGGILSTRWVTSSLRSVSAVWESFEALVDHFQTASQDVKTRDGKD